MNDPQEWTPETVRNLLRSLEGYPEQEQFQVVATAHNAALAANDDNWRERFRKFEKIEDRFGPAKQRNER